LAPYQVTLDMPGVEGLSGISGLDYWTGILERAWATLI